MQASIGSIAELQLWTEVPVYIDIVYTSELYNNVLRFMTRCLPCCASTTVKITFGMYLNTFQGWPYWNSV